MIDSLNNGTQRLTCFASAQDGSGLFTNTQQTVQEGGHTTSEHTAQHADSPPPADPGGMSMWMVLIIWGVVIVGFWLLMMRPQKKREKKMKEMQASIKAGDNVVTNGGMFGRVADVGTDCFVVEMGISGRTVKVPILKSDVLGVREPVLTPPPKESAES